MRKILCITLEPVAEKMAGPAIRCLELAKQLAHDFEVTVFSPHKTEKPYSGVQPAKLKVVVGQSKSELYRLAQAADLLFIQANVLKTYPLLERLGKYIAVDLYDPYLFSVLAQYKDDPISGSSSYRLMHQMLDRHMAAADFAICASEKQRDYWLGRFCALGRLTPQIYDIDPTARQLIDVVPFGVPGEKPVYRRAALRGVTAGIGESDKLLIWGGGIWQWFDPLTVIQAVALLRAEIPDLRLFFMGMKSPNPQVPLMDMATRAVELSQKLEILDKHVFFSDSWIDYDDRVNYLLEADVAVSAHFDLIETRFSFRTRLLDYFWAGVPILTTGGDELAQQIQEQEAGIVLPYEDTEAWASAIAKILSDPEMRTTCGRNSSRIAERFSWERISQPLHRFCRRPYRLPRLAKVTMPSLMERAHAVYARGGKEAVARKCRDIWNDLWR